MGFDQLPGTVQTTSLRMHSLTDIGWSSNASIEYWSPIYRPFPHHSRHSTRATALSARPQYISNTGETSSFYRTSSLCNASIEAGPKPWDSTQHLWQRRKGHHTSWREREADQRRWGKRQRSCIRRIGHQSNGRCCKRTQENLQLLFLWNWLHAAAIPLCEIRSHLYKLARGEVWSVLQLFCSR